MKILAYVIIFVAFMYWGVPSLRYLLGRFKLWLKLKLTPDTYVCYKKHFSIFNYFAGSTSDFIIYRKGIIYIVKLCGIFRKMTTITATDSKNWQFASKVFIPLPMAEPFPVVKDRALNFNLLQEKSEFEKDMTSANISEIKPVVLFAPTPSGFYIKGHDQDDALGFGSDWKGYTLASVDYFKKLLKNSSNNNSKLAKADWDKIAQKYRQMK
jgi:hypothetical protein